MDTSGSHETHPSASHASHPFLSGMVMLLVGLAVGAAGAWYGLSLRSVAPRVSGSPSPSAAVGVPSVSALPQASSGFFTLGACRSDSDCTYDVTIFDSAGVPKNVGTTTGMKEDGFRPRIVRAGPGWIVFERPVDGLGGYYLFGGLMNLTYANLAGTIVPLSANSLLVDAGFSPDLSHVAVVSRVSSGYRLAFWNLANGVSDATVAVPSTGDSQQAGLPTYSLDGSRIAVAAGYGPDSERGEIYVAPLSNLSALAKVADTPRSPRDLWWTTDGSLVWR